MIDDRVKTKTIRPAARASTDRISAAAIEGACERSVRELVVAAALAAAHAAPCVDPTRNSVT
jgi:hypothetical protein